MLAYIKARRERDKMPIDMNVTISPSLGWNSVAHQAHAVFSNHLSHTGVGLTSDQHDEDREYLFHVGIGADLDQHGSREIEMEKDRAGSVYWCLHCQSPLTWETKRWSRALWCILNEDQDHPSTLSFRSSHAASDSTWAPKYNYTVWMRYALIHPAM